jgi:hypothetical protein
MLDVATNYQWAMGVLACLRTGSKGKHCGHMLQNVSVTEKKENKIKKQS